MADSLAQSLVEAAAEAARAAFFGAVVGYVGQVGANQITFAPEEIKLIFGSEVPVWEQVARAALAVTPVSAPAAARQLLFDHADKLLAAAADLYRVAREIREGQ